MTGKKDSGPNQFIRLPETSHGGVAHDALGSSRWTPVFMKQDFSILFSWKESWRDGVDPDTSSSPFTRQELTQAQNGCLGGRVGDHPG